MREIQAAVTESHAIAAELHGLTLKIPPEAAAEAVPGQFAHIKIPGDDARMLRRPISIFSLKDDLLFLAIQPKKEGTQRLTALRPGDSLTMLFPLGKGFSPGEAEDVWLVGGGVGVAPLRFAAERFAAVTSRAFFGYRTSAHIYAVNDFETAGCSVTVCTDDGSSGIHGLVTKPLLEALSEKKPSLIMACGPAPMLRAVRDIALERDIPIQVSLEQRMGCGFGACLTCSCKASWDGYLRVCADGPVFDGKAVSL